MHQVLFRIPIPGQSEGIPIFGFGMMLFLAFVVCTWLTGRRAERAGVSRQVIHDLALWIFIGGIAGARLNFLLWNGFGIWNSWTDNPVMRFFAIWEGGLVLYGSFVGGLSGYLLAHYFGAGKLAIPTAKLADIIAPSVALGVCLGRLGCLLNGCCYGAVAPPDRFAVTFPLSAPARYELTRQGLQASAGFTLVAPGSTQVAAVEPGSAAEQAGLRPGDRIVGAEGQAIETGNDLHRYLGSPDTWPRGKKTLQLTVERPTSVGPQPLAAFQPHTLGLFPTQLYESISMVLLYVLLTAYEPFRRRDGEVMALLMFGYGLHRYFNEQLRSDHRPIAYESYVSLLLIAIGLIWFVWLRSKVTPGSNAAMPEMTKTSS